MNLNAALRPRRPYLGRQGVQEWNKQIDCLILVDNSNIFIEGWSRNMFTPN